VNSALRTPHSAIGLTLVCFALKEEAAPFRKLVAGRSDVSILVTGIGRANSERTLREFLRTNNPRRVFTCGFAGGLDPKLQTGDVVFSTKDAGLAEALSKSGARSVTFTCVDRIATTAVEKQMLRASTQADAVEMESEAIQTVCQERGIPCATVRVISDTAQEDLPLDFNQLANPDQSLNFGKLALAIAKSPGKIPALLRLQKITSLAAQRLAATLSQIIGP
jgi:adenosylhomocysteine nucleosidase